MGLGGRDPIGRDRKAVVEAAKGLLHCLEHKSDEDAYNWCQDIQYWLYANEITSRARLEESVKRGSQGRD